MFAGGTGVIQEPRDLLLAQDRGQAVRHPTTYRWITRILRLVFGLSSLVILTYIFLWPSLQDQNLSKDVRNTAVPATADVVAPRFDAVDDQGQPFTLTAERATQDSQNLDLIHLNDPHGTLTLSNGIILDLTAKRADYHQTKKDLILTGEVTLKTNDGYVGTTDVAHINVQTRALATPGSVRITGPDVQLTAVAMTGDAQHDRLVFNGPATLTFTKGLW